MIARVGNTWSVTDASGMTTTVEVSRRHGTVEVSGKGLTLTPAEARGYASVLVQAAAVADARQGVPA